jgi:hypothetical protein
VNAGGDPDRDDFGLPPIDIVIPDDARELDRDVQAYQRELRALRRRRRANRLRRPLTRDGMVLPLLAACLMLALLTSTLLIMFAADQTGMPRLPPRPAVTHHNSPKPTAAAGQIGGLLPVSAVVIGGKSIQLRKVAAARPAVLTLVPQNCQCVSTLRQLGTQAGRVHVLVVLVGTGGGTQQLARLAAQAGQTAARVADDTKDVLATTYRARGVTAILVRPDGTVASVIRQLPQQQLQTGLRELAAVKSAGH